VKPGGRKAGLDDIRWDTLRHTFSSLPRANGKD